MIQYLYLGRVDYDQGLRLQAEIAALRLQGRVENVLLLLEHPPVLTLGRNADRTHVLASGELLAQRGVALHATNRGGDVTYHGPGQLVGYPIFDLRSLHNDHDGRMGPVDFVRRMEEALIRLCAGFGVRAGRIAGLTGVWCGVNQRPEIRDQESGNRPLTEQALAAQMTAAEPERKIAAIGIHVSRGITSHGFAFNVSTDLRDFALIVPCGIAGRPVTSLKNELLDREPQEAEELPSLETVANRAAREFGQVFDQQVLAVESLEALRSQAEAGPVKPPRFPAEDTPMRVPAEVQRLLHKQGGPVQA